MFVPRLPGLACLTDLAWIGYDLLTFIVFLRTREGKVLYTVGAVGMLGTVATLHAGTLFGACRYT